MHILILRIVLASPEMPADVILLLMSLTYVSNTYFNVNFAYVSNVTSDVIAPNHTHPTFQLLSSPKSATIS